MTFFISILPVNKITKQKPETPEQNLILQKSNLAKYNQNYQNVHDQQTQLLLSA